MNRYRRVNLDGSGGVVSADAFTEYLFPILGRRKVSLDLWCLPPDESGPGGLLDGGVISVQVKLLKTPSNERDNDIPFASPDRTGAFFATSLIPPNGNGATRNTLGYPIQGPSVQIESGGRRNFVHATTEDEPEAAFIYYSAQLVGEPGDPGTAKSASVVAVLRALD
jgi:hypothetical protein